MRIRLGLSVLFAFLLAAPHAFAQSYPTRNVTIVVTTAPGALTDVLARAIGQQLSQKWNQPVVIDNRPGGAYAIAAVAVMQAPVDGYTLLATETGMFTTQPHLHPKGRQTFDAQADFVPVSGMDGIPMAVIAHPSLPAKSIGDLIALAKAKPGSINYGTSGPGTAPHMGTLLLESMAGIKLTPVHYRGVAPALNDLIAGHISLITMGPSVALPTYRAGKLAILGLGAPDKRVPQLKEIPTVAETVPGYSAGVSFALFARTGTPKDIMEKINADVQAVLRDPEFQKKFLDLHVLQPTLGSQAEFARHMASESDKWAKLIRETNVKID